MLISFIIPVLDEQDSLIQLHDEIVQNVAPNSYEIIFIDDGSTDGSLEVMRTLSKRDTAVKIVSFRRNFGKAAALQTGFDLAKGQVVFTMDADLQDNPIDIPKFLKQLEDGYDLVSGWKKKRHDPLNKRIPSRFFNAITSMYFKVRLHDFNCGYKAYRQEVIKEVDLYGELHRYIPVLANAKGYRIGEIEVQHRERKHGKSKYGFERYLRGFLDLLSVRMVTIFRSSPLYLFGSWGAFFVTAGGVLSLYLTIMKVFYNMPLSNRPLLFLGVLLILVGMQFFSIGLVSELIVSKMHRITMGNSISIKEKINIDEEV
ncbi:MAG: glycosyltransferase family 2 protein [Candidatus Cloacimonetes bacterium]|nr:glycosyltransferase family 2 protein [Candidatus Cloacimonadota bacterium]